MSGERGAVRLLYSVADRIGRPVDRAAEGGRAVALAEPLRVSLEHERRLRAARRPAHELAVAAVGGPALWRRERSLAADEAAPGRDRGVGVIEAVGVEHLVGERLQHRAIGPKLPREAARDVV